MRTGGQTGPSLFYGTELYLQDNYRNGNKPMRITEGGNEDQMSPEVSLKLGWDELEILGWTCTSEVGVILLPRLALWCWRSWKDWMDWKDWNGLGGDWDDQEDLPSRLSL